MLKYLAGAGVVVLALWPRVAFAAPAWEQWQSVAGVFDLGGPRSDGSLLVAGSAALYTLSPDGTLTPFARGPGGYSDDPGAEAYLAVSPGLSGGAGCAFARDDTFILRLHGQLGVTRVDAAGSQTAPFANVAALSLNAIAFDTTGQFNRALLVKGSVNGKTEVAAIDCDGSVRVITNTAPVLEGGIAVAPATFGAVGGDLIAPDELSGLIWAIAPDGSATQLVNSGLPVGLDTGVESVAFVPAGFTTRGGSVYYSDRSTPGSPYPGTDHVLRLSTANLVAAGVQDGDLLAATEGGALMIDVRCTVTCHVIPVVSTPTNAHGEGHLAFTLNPAPSPSPTATVTQNATKPSSSSGIGPVGFIVVAVVIAASLGAFVFWRRR